MAYTTGTRHSTISLGTRLAEVFRDFSESYTQWRNYRSTKAALMELSARELDDLGLSRGNIHDAAMKAAYGEDYDQSRTGL